MKVHTSPKQTNSLQVFWSWGDYKFPMEHKNVGRGIIARDMDQWEVLWKWGDWMNRRGEKICNSDTQDINHQCIHVLTFLKPIFQCHEIKHHILQVREHAHGHKHGEVIAPRAVIDYHPGVFSGMSTGRLWITTKGSEPYLVCLLFDLVPACAWINSHFKMSDVNILLHFGPEKGENFPWIICTVCPHMVAACTPSCIWLLQSPSLHLFTAQEICTYTPIKQL